VFAGKGRVTLPCYAFKFFGSPPVNTKCYIEGPCNVPIALLTFCEHTSDRSHCLIEYLRLLNYSLGLVLG